MTTLLFQPAKHCSCACHMHPPTWQAEVPHWVRWSSTGNVPSWRWGKYELREKLQELHPKGDSGAKKELDTPWHPRFLWLLRLCREQLHFGLGGWLLMQLRKSHGAETVASCLRSAWCFKSAQPWIESVPQKSSKQPKQIFCSDAECCKLLALLWVMQVLALGLKCAHLKWKLQTFPLSIPMSRCRGTPIPKSIGIASPSSGKEMLQIQQLAGESPGCSQALEISAKMMQLQHGTCKIV